MLMVRHRLNRTASTAIEAVDRDTAGAFIDVVSVDVRLPRRVVDEVPDLHSQILRPQSEIQNCPTRALGTRHRLWRGPATGVARRARARVQRVLDGAPCSQQAACVPIAAHSYD